MFAFIACFRFFKCCERAVLLKSSDAVSSVPSSLNSYSKMMPAISTKDYAVGDLIFSEMPCVKVVAKDAKSEYCDNCLCQSKTVTLKKCTACMNMHYCSKSCQKEDWMAGHKYECKFYKLHFFGLENDIPRLFLRFYLLLKNKKDLVSRKVNLQYNESVEKSFDDLNKFNGEMSPKLTLAFQVLVQTFEDCGIGNVNRSMLFEYFRKYFQNAIAVFSKYDIVAHGIYMSPSVFGHSCAPNATLSFNGYRLNIRAIKEIHKGDPITFSRTRLDADRKQRHSSLEDILIDCKCERCTSNSDREFDYVNMERLEMAMKKAGLIYQQLDKAFQVGKQLIPLYKHLCGYDIIVSFHLMRMVELYKKIPVVELDSGVGDVLEDTVKHVKVTHGMDHPLYKEYLQLLEEYQKAQGEIKKLSGQEAVPRVKETDEAAIFYMFSKLSLQFK